MVLERLRKLFEKSSEKNSEEKVEEVKEEIGFEEEEWLSYYVS